MSDAFRFGAFLIPYCTIRFASSYTPDPNAAFNAFPGAGRTNLPVASVSLMTFILLISSVLTSRTIVEAPLSKKKSVIKWLIWTIVGGFAFLPCQAWEWTHLIAAEHAVLANGQLDVVGQTVRVNPWGLEVHGPALAEALKNTPHDGLVKLAG